MAVGPLRRGRVTGDAKGFIFLPAERQQAFQIKSFDCHGVGDIRKSPVNLLFDRLTQDLHIETTPRFTNGLLQCGGLVLSAVAD